jgi:hypothetical protein
LCDAKQGLHRRSQEVIGRLGVVGGFSLFVSIAELTMLVDKISNGASNQLGALSHSSTAQGRDVCEQMMSAVSNEIRIW